MQTFIYLPTHTDLIEYTHLHTLPNTYTSENTLTYLHKHTYTSKTHINTHFKEHAFIHTHTHTHTHTHISTGSNQGKYYKLSVPSLEDALDLFKNHDTYLH